MKFFSAFVLLVALAAADSSSFAKQNNNVVQPVPPGQAPWWTLEEMEALVQDPSTDPDLAAYLQNILDAVNDYLISGPPTDIQVIGAHEKPELIENPITIPSPLPLVDVESSPVTPPAAVTSPLVQIIVNIQQ